MQFHPCLLYVALENFIQVELGELKINPRLTNVLAEKRKEKTKLLHKYVFANLFFY